MPQFRGQRTTAGVSSFSVLFEPGSLGVHDITVTVYLARKLPGILLSPLSSLHQSAGITVVWGRAQLCSGSEDESSGPRVYGTSGSLSPPLTRLRPAV